MPLPTTRRRKRQITGSERQPWRRLPPPARTPSRRRRRWTSRRRRRSRSRRRRRLSPRAPPPRRRRRRWRLTSTRSAFATASRSAPSRRRTPMPRPRVRHLAAATRPPRRRRRRRRLRSRRRRFPSPPPPRLFAPETLRGAAEASFPGGEAPRRASTTAQRISSTWFPSRARISRAPTPAHPSPAARWRAPSRRRTAPRNLLASTRPSPFCITTTTAPPWRLKSHCWRRTRTRIVKPTTK